ncbi:929_t:CDS:2 [Cetraspora pellucida]|uniref:929_t:CDS:1 n=1 Tax=Cetraspora pellucida TaxID=1433469 RepID=A0A9N9DEI8_9GLOM|nr:929_t:CDS:2 [Cetraspora pellucida]
MLLTENLSIDPLISGGVIPDVVDNFVLEALLDIKYGEKKVEFGNELSIEETQKAPDVSFVFGESDPNSLYTLILTDPDAPSRKEPTKGEWRHWIVGNIPSNGKLSEATHLDNYQGPAPPPNTDYHRYVFLLYRQPLNHQQTSHIDYPDLNKVDRPNFKARKFAEQYGLKLISSCYYQSKKY